MAKNRRAGRATRAAGVSPAIENRQMSVAIEVVPLEGFFRKACREIGLQYPPAAVCFVTDREMKRLNGTYRGKNKTTDVLSFPSKERAKPKGLKRAARMLRGDFLGDIAISAAEAGAECEVFWQNDDRRNSHSAAAWDFAPDGI
jgi:rRNA maturation RNase YbeY